MHTSVLLNIIACRDVITHALTRLLSGNWLELVCQQHVLTSLDLVSVMKHM